MKEFIDQMDNSIRLKETPRRIVSLVPSQTELLYSLGLDDRVVGITKFCIYPEEWFRSKKRVGGTKDVDIDKVKALKPDLIIGNKEENDKNNIDLLKNIAPIWMSDISDLEDALEMILKLGLLLEVSESSHELISKIKSNFSKLESSIKSTKKSVLYLIWRNPYLAAGNNTFINDMIVKCGFLNFINEDRYPEINMNVVTNPDFVFLSSEPYPFKKQHIKEIQTIFPKATVKLVDGEMFSWYGSRLVEAPDYFLRLVQ